MDGGGNKTVHIEKGTVLQCDSAIKVYLESLNEDLGPDGFIIEDLGELGLFVKREKVSDLEEKVEKMLDSNHFDEEARKRTRRAQTKRGGN
eukprot:m.129509 g.129509  ORF g.129509 m.129509 type:complete len:91 (-) comp13048_c0_seq2:3788-4060(-)